MRMIAPSALHLKPQHLQAHLAQTVALAPELVAALAPHHVQLALDPRLMIVLSVLPERTSSTGLALAQMPMASVPTRT